jgi:hypothetical protein
MDWVRALPNVLRNAMAPATSNLSPAHVLLDAGASILAAPVELAIAASFALASLMNAYLDRELSPRSISLGAGAMTFASTTVWDHYLVVLVPLTLYWWKHGDRALRLMLWTTNVVLLGLWIHLDVLLPYRAIVVVLVVLAFVVMGRQRTTNALIP